MNNANFLFTKSSKTATELIELGLPLVSGTDDGWFFINDSKFTFSDMEDVTFTNKLFI